MSGPKGGSYSVVSAEELERRALQQAVDRYRRSREALESVADALSRYGVRVDKAPAEVAGASRAVNARCDQLESEVKRLQARLTDLRVAAAIAAIPRVSFDVAPEKSADAEPSSAMPVAQQSDAGAAANALVERMVHECGSEPSGDVLRKLALVTDSTSPAQQRLALADLRYAVQVVRDRHRESVRAARQREDVLAALDGCPGLEARRAYEAIDRIAPGDPVPLALGEAQAISARDREQQDSAFVTATVVEVLKGLGYDIGDTMSVTVAQKGALLELPGHPDHIARMRAQAGQLRFSVVRVAGDHSDKPGDMAAEEDSCALFGELRQGLAEAGVAWTVDRHDAPGAVPVARTRQRPESVAPRRAKKSSGRRANTAREREAGR